ncbi:hypothetical protein [Aurantimonas sp. A3-2-R12]|uniref:hypothetical protein n=1 Tax=Aurantimonas sp. A3-2-R12 TaxID=3114362 RepID=UPI002E184B8C|nr:hypothetical protein [Aurantimonas sp. A3-2-R12]
MAGLLGFLAAGAAKGAGEGIVAEARAKREAAIADLENSRLLSREQADRDFRAGEGDKSRAATAAEGRLNRSEIVTAEDGTSMIFDGQGARSLKDDTGKSVKTLRTSKSDAPSDVRTAEWLITQGIAKTPEDAWTKVRSAREGVTTSADIEEMTEKAVKTELGDSIRPPKPEEVEESRQRNRARIMKNLGIGDTNDGGTSSAPEPAKVVRPAGMDDAEIIEQAKDAIRKGGDAAGIRSDLRMLGIDPAKAGI